MGILMFYQWAKIFELGFIGFIMAVGSFNLALKNKLLVSNKNHNRSEMMGYGVGKTNCCDGPRARDIYIYAHVYGYICVIYRYIIISAAIIEPVL